MMIREKRRLLLKDLCARLPYNVVIRCTDNDTDYKCFLTTDILNELLLNIEYYDYKPYLRPMSSMTEEELKEFYMVEGMDTNSVILNKPQYDWHFTTNGIDYLLSHHFDFRGLIEMGLALEAPEDMYKTE